MTHAVTPMRQSPHTRGAVTALALCMLCVQAWSAESGNREREALRRAQQSLRQAQEERDAVVDEKGVLTQDKAKLAGELKQVAAKVRGAESQAASQRAKALQLEADVARQQAELAQAQARETQLTAQLTQALAKQAEQARLLTVVQGMLIDRTRESQTLQAQNQALYTASIDAINVYRSQSPSAWLQASDQLLGYRGVRVENISEVLRDRVEAARFKALPTEATAASGVN